MSEEKLLHKNSRDKLSRFEKIGDIMKRTTSAVWHEKYNRWQINVQKDGERKSFYSSIVGREGKRVCHQKADEWLDENITRRNTRISDLYSEYKVTGSINVYNEHTKGKNDNAVRRFVLTDSAQKELDAQPMDNSSKYIFGDLTLSGFSKRWTAYCEYNNIPHISLYELRHTFVSVVKNLPAGQIKALVGHSKNMDTFGTYSHEINGELEQTALQIEDLFSNILNNNEIK